jgi:uncharacterized membrane-anchored protein YhcB (DUF1043 family)
MLEIIIGLVIVVVLLYVVIKKNKKAEETFEEFKNEMNEKYEEAEHEFIHKRDEIIEEVKRSYKEAEDNFTDKRDEMIDSAEDKVNSIKKKVKRKWFNDGKKQKLVPVDEINALESEWTPGKLKKKGK